MQRALARKVRFEKFHLVTEDAPPLQVDVLGVGGRKGNGQQLDARLLRRSAGLVVVAALAGRDNIAPKIDPAVTERLDVIP